MGQIDRPQRQKTRDGFSDGFARSLAAARGGSQEALGELLGSLRRYLLLMAESELDDRLRVKLAASDAVQQTFLKAQQALDDFAGSTEEEWRGWLRQTLLNEIAQADRHFRHTAKCEIDREVRLPDGGSSFGGRQLASAEETPSKQAVAKEDLARLQGALAGLSDDYQEVIERRNARQSFEEIGQAMGRSASAAQKLWSRAVEKLGQELRGE